MPLPGSSAPDERDVVSLEEAARRVGVSVADIRRWIAQGSLSGEVSRAGDEKRVDVRIAELRKLWPHRFRATLPPKAPAETVPAGDDSPVAIAATDPPALLELQRERDEAVAARVSSEAELSIERAAGERRRERSDRDDTREDPTREIETRLALRCSRLERELQRVTGDGDVGWPRVAAPTRPRAKGWRGALRILWELPGWAKGAAAGFILALVVAGPWGDERPVDAASASPEVLSLRAELDAARRETALAQREARRTRRASESVLIVAPPTLLNAGPVGPPLAEPVFEEVAESPAPELAADADSPACHFATETRAGGDLRSVLGPCLGLWSAELGATLGTNRHGGRRYCRHHQFFGRSRASSLEAVQAAAEFAIEEGMLPPLVGLRVDRGAMAFLEDELPGRLASGLEGPDGGQHTVVPLADPDTYAVEAWVTTRDDEAVTTRRAFRMHLRITEGLRGDELQRFVWLD